MTVKIITEEEFNKIRDSKECPACGAGETHFRKIFSDLEIISCSLCGSQITEHAYKQGNPTFMLKTEKEFVKSKEEALAYLSAYKLNILAYGRKGHYVNKEDIESNTPVSILAAKSVGVNDAAYIKPYSLYKTKHLLAETEIECTGEDEVVCPYCGWEDSDSWEYDDCDDSEVSCGRCERVFYLNTQVVRSYTTTRKEGEAGKLPGE